MAGANYNLVVCFEESFRTVQRSKFVPKMVTVEVTPVEKMRLSGWYLRTSSRNWCISVSILGISF